MLGDMRVDRSLVGDGGHPGVCDHHRLCQPTDLGRGVCTVMLNNDRGLLRNHLRVPYCETADGGASFADLDLSLTDLGVACGHAVVRLVCDVVAQDVHDEFFLDGLPHRVQVE